MEGRKEGIFSILLLKYTNAILILNYTSAILILKSNGRTDITFGN